MTRTARRCAACATVALAAVLLPATAAQAIPPAPCIPSVDGNGPRVIIAPDYQDPTKSDVYYESDGISLQVDLCLD